MASVYYLYGDTFRIEKEILRKQRDQYEANKEVYFSVTTIQRYWRGYQTRKLLKNLNKNATIIQRYTRGWLTRWKLPKYLRDAYDEKCTKRYYDIATQIIAQWRGFVIRKRLSIKHYILEKKLMQEKNEIMQRAMATFSDQFVYQSIQNIEKPQSIESIQHTKIQRKVIEMLYDRHHLLRTENCEGVLSLHGQKELSTLEKMLKSFDYQKYMNRLRRIHDNEGPPEKDYLFSDKKMQDLEDQIRSQTTATELRELPVLEVMPQKNPFICFSKVPSPTYERELGPLEKYTGPQTFMTRSCYPGGNVSESKFDLDVHKMTPNPHPIKPYYVDFLYKKCRKHNTY